MYERIQEGQSVVKEVEDENNHLKINLVYSIIPS